MLAGVYKSALLRVRHFSSSVKIMPKLVDKAQEAALSEQCILVDENDRPLGSATKRHVHSVKEGLPLHRAFSVFLFNEAGDMLVQRRSVNKVTFPDCYTNACCSHPLFEIPNERVEAGALGVCRAAQRRLSHELGVPAAEVPPESFQYLTRIHYRDEGDGLWGEHEMDYILFLQRDVTLKPNPEEVSEVIYVPKLQIDSFISNLSAPLTPWFSLILQHRLRLWWDNLHRLEQFQDHKQIHKF